MGQTDLQPKGTPVDTLNADGTWDRLGSIAQLLHQAATQVWTDADPIFGASPVRGFYVLAGFSGHGFMHGPVCGLLLAELLLDGAAHSVDVSALDYARFAEGRTIAEYNVI